MCVFNLRKTTFLTKIDREIFLPSPNINPSLIVFVARPLASLARGTWVVTQIYTLQVKDKFPIGESRFGVHRLVFADDQP